MRDQNDLNAAYSAVANAPKIVVISGPTAVGKTSLGVELALRFNGEVVNADSRYLYRGMDIGVAKPDQEERRGVPHHLIDICDPAEDMSLATYQALATDAIAEVHKRGHLPLLVGGTPLYLNAVVEGWRIPKAPPHPDIRSRLETEAETLGLPVLTARLAKIDPIAAERSGQNRRRVIRALEIHEVTGQPMSAIEGKGPRPFDALEVGLTMPRDALYAAIDRRVGALIDRGLVDEVRGLLESGLSPTAPSMSSIGYRQLVPYLEGGQSLAEAIEQIKVDTHRFVRKQTTWFRKNPRLILIDVSQPSWHDDLFARVNAFLSNTNRAETANHGPEGMFDR